jgi:hypothetical protein
MIPNPLIYLSALMLGVILGLATDAWLGWSWWLFAPLMVVTVWLVFLVSAIPRLGELRSIRMELLDVVDPKGWLDRRHRALNEILRTCPFPLYGLDSYWTGLRMIGGHGGGEDGVNSVELAFGDPAQDGREHQAFDLRETAMELWHTTRRPPPDLPPPLAAAWRQRRFEEDIAREVQWTKVPIPVDGETIEFDWLAEGANWVARARLDDRVVRLTAHDFPVGSVRLETVNEVQPYIDGWRRFLEEQRRHHPE